MGLFNSILNVIYHSIFIHTSCGKHHLSGYGAQEDNAVDVHEVTAWGDFFVFIKDALWYS